MTFLPPLSLRVTRTCVRDRERKWRELREEGKEEGMKKRSKGSEREIGESGGREGRWEVGRDGWGKDRERGREEKGREEKDGEKE